MLRLVIVGASLAGLRAAQAARSAGHDGGIVMIGREPHLPYTRPPLSKELLQATQEIEDLALQVGELDVDWRLGVPATGLDREHRRVALEDGTEACYDRLIIATGCRARSWDGPGAELAGVHTLRELEDAVALRTALSSSGRLLIVGAGFIGCEVAASARALGVEVTLVDIAAHPLLPFGPQLGERWARMHRERGVDLRLRVAVAELRGVSGRVEHAELTDGTTVNADTVLLALGSRLNTEWLAGSGLERDPAIRCDSTLTTVSDPDILAAGDIAAVPVALADGTPLRVEHWTTAAEHGQLAGRNALLDPADRAAHTNPPYFWSDQYGSKIQALGCPALADRIELLEQSPEDDRFVAACVSGERMIGIVGMNAARRLPWYRKQLTHPLPLEQVKLALTQESSTLGTPMGAPV
ncbi:MAG TPA: FAD-dependent oxidoreductase [Solirubrobacteraceae bacterium]|jgi:NADPH-dependent 2,4-dienoyl-CoA reductase/sulfur reductase-like enzyme|nr:FAD-dependent oxidoreductase [Solirubrobacteraceae bacterium]